MTVDELKTEADKLSAGDLCALAEWIEGSDRIREIRRTALVREIQIGLDQLDRGDFIECRNDEELHSFFEGIKASGRQRLDAAKRVGQ